MLSEAGSQGLQVVFVFPDRPCQTPLAAGGRGVMSLFGARVILSGVADVTTLQQLSLIAGDWDRPVQTTPQRPAGMFAAGQASTSQACVNAPGAHPPA